MMTEKRRRELKNRLKVDIIFTFSNAEMKIIKENIRHKKNLSKILKDSEKSIRELWGLK